MARHEMNNTITHHVVTDDDMPSLPTMRDAVNFLDAAQSEAYDNAFALAKQISYDGPLTVGGAEDRLRQGMRRTINECLEMGKTLLILKELVAHGEFQTRVEMLGLGYQTGKKFMAATLKFSKGYSNTLLAAGSQTKMLELLVLDDGEIEALESGDSVRGLTLDKIETMSVSELKKALRDANERIEAKDAVIKDKSAFIDSQSEKLAGLENKVRVESLKPISPEQRLLDLRTNLQITAADIKTNVMTMLRKNVQALVDYTEQTGTSEAAFMASCLIEISRELAILRADYYLPDAIDGSPVDPIWAAMAAGKELEVPGAAEFAARMTQQDSE